MKWLARFLWLAIVFGLLELGCNVWIEHFGDALDRTRRIVEAEPRLGWHQRPNLDTRFFGHALRTNELGWRTGPLSPGAGAVLLGPSSAFGWGVAAEETYAARLEKLLPGQPRVVNASEIGFSTQQGLLLLEGPELKALGPKLLLIAYGVNDIDRHRFYFQSPEPDSVALSRPQSDSAVAAFRALSRSALLSVLYKTANAFRTMLPRPSAAPFPAPSVRVPPDEFARNLRFFAAAGKSLGARVVFLGTPVNLPPYFPPPPETAIHLEALYARAVSSFGRSELADARRDFEALLNSELRRNESAYYLAEIARREGRVAEAREFAGRAIATEPLRIHRDVQSYNALMKKVAAEEKIPFVDLYAEFPEADKAPFFVDPIHPSAAGHARIAAAVARAIAHGPGTR